ncbi:hypothetical protein P409_08865 [Inquilinus limosus MP06]|uniref:Uncharacterized protein n=1 Tax=Inquilinus limosus MP06 TaxID=1398085 RepID=A0A0A0DCD8_9PROT|nr:hypothetical protein P409_08865 [Inquilinus limosus MP06]
MAEITRTETEIAAPPDPDEADDAILSGLIELGMTMARAFQAAGTGQRLRPGSARTRRLGSRCEPNVSPRNLSCGPAWGHGG